MIFLLLIPLIGLAIMPPIGVGLSLDPLLSTYLFVLTAMAAVCLLFVKVNPIIKIIAMGGLVNVFLSQDPFFSWMAYASLIACCYFYVACTRVKDWKPVFRAVQALVFLELAFLMAQHFHHDALFNTSIKANIWGTIGNKMQFSSFCLMLTSFLLPFCTVNLFFPFVVYWFTHSVWVIFCGVVGLFVYLWGESKVIAWLVLIAGLSAFLAFGGVAKIKTNIPCYRIPIWIKTVQVSADHPLIGYGIGTYKTIFPVLEGEKLIHNSEPFCNAHNAFVQMLFEAGDFGLAIMLAVLGYLFVRIYKAKDFLLLAGFCMLIANLLVYFPDRNTSTCLLLVGFLALCEMKIKKEIV